jgi:hypothetical protein
MKDDLKMKSLRFFRTNFYLWIHMIEPCNQKLLIDIHAWKLASIRWNFKFMYEYKHYDFGALHVNSVNHKPRGVFVLKKSTCVTINLVRPSFLNHPKLKKCIHRESLSMAPILACQIREKKLFHKLPNCGDSLLFGERLLD